MTISTAVDRWDYLGAGATGPYNFTRKVMADTDLQVRKLDTASGAVLAALALGLDYSVIGIGSDSGGYVTTVAGVPGGQTLQILAKPPLTQPTDFKNQGDFLPKRHEDSYDRLAAQILWLQDQLNRTTRVPSQESTILTDLPTKALRANLVLGFDSAGQPVALSGTGADAALRTDLANQAGPGNQLVAIPKTAAENAAGVTIVVPYRAPGDVRRYGAIADGSTSASPAVESAKSVGLVYFAGEPGDVYKLDTAVTFSSRVRMWADRGVSLKPAMPNAGGKMFTFATDDVLVENLIVDGTGVTGVLSGNTYLFFGGDSIMGGTKRFRHTYRNIHVKACTRSDGLTMSSNLLVTHPLYVDNVDDVSVENYTVDGVSGSGFFGRNINRLKIDGFTIKDAQWYNITLDSGCDGFVIRNGLFNCTLTTGVYWGGALNLMSQTTGTRNKNGLCERCKFTGYYSYGAPIRILSITNFTIRDFVVEDCQAGSWAASAELSGVRVDTRGTSTSDQNGPCHNVRICNFEMTAPLNTDKHRAIYISNSWQSARNPCTDIYIHDGRALSIDTSKYFAEGVVFHGLDGGIENVHINRIAVSTDLQTSPSVGGAIGFTGNSANGGCLDIWLGDNDLADLGTPAASHQVGIFFQAWTDRVYQGLPNRVDNYFYGVRTSANSGPTLNDIDDQQFANCTNAELYSVVPARFRKMLMANAVYDPPNIVDGANTTTDITVTGAALGDFVQASFSLTPLNVMIFPFVRVANSVRILFQNESGGPVDLGSGTLSVRVQRKGTAG